MGGIENKIMKQIAKEKKQEGISDQEFIETYIKLIHAQIQEFENQKLLLDEQIKTAQTVRKTLLSILRKIRNKS